MSEYIIVGDTDEYSGCLICCCGESIETANITLNRMKNFPNENDKKLMEGHSDLRIEKIPKSACWWNWSCD